MQYLVSIEFSSPHGDFSFSILRVLSDIPMATGFRPLTGISLFLLIVDIINDLRNRFSSPHGDFSFSIGFGFPYALKRIAFSSPHGDFSFSIMFETMRTELTEKVFVPSRGFLFFYPISYSPYKSRAIFIICGANIFKPSECYF